MAHGHFGGMQVACLLWQRVCSEKFPSRTSLSGGFGKEAFLCVPLLLGSKRAVSPKCGHEPKIWVRVCRLCPSTLEIREKICVKMRKVMAHGHFGGMQVACLLWQRVCSEKFPSRTSLSGGFGKEAFLCVPLLLGSKRAVSP